MDSSFNDVFDHVDNSSFLPYAGPQCTPSKRKVDNREKKRNFNMVKNIIKTAVHTLVLPSKG